MVERREAEFDLLFAIVGVASSTIFFPISIASAAPTGLNPSKHEHPVGCKRQLVPHPHRENEIFQNCISSSAKLTDGPQKPVKEEGDDLETDKIEEIVELTKDSLSGKDVKNEAATENGRKRKRSAQAKDSIDSVKEENGIKNKPSANDAVKFVGYRTNGNRRKNKPRRAAEAGVECNLCLWIGTLGIISLGVDIQQQDVWEARKQHMN
ncbi:hypothetical protein NL676_001722 [Syzygium grande]|nr:hypothetical protein NL676_001722 [Syzygium grande]